ncbi:MAG: hypothetical protein AABW47_00645 [Nanoarchaeota archaeon]
MKIITKYYDKNSKLKVLNEGGMTSATTLRFKKLTNKREVPCCDFQGQCTNNAYAEVYPFLGKKRKNKGWSYLCKKHYYEEQKRLNWKLSACLKVEG